MLGKLHFSYLGYGLLEAWSVSLFFGRMGDLPGLAGAWDYGALGYTALTNVSGVAVVLATALIVLLCAKADVISRRKLLTAVTCAINALGTLLVLFGGVRLMVVGFVITGLANAWLWISWGDIYARLDTESTELAVITSAVLQAMAVILIFSLPVMVQSVAIVVLVPLAGVMYVIAYDRTYDIPLDEAVSEQGHSPAVFEHSFAARLVVGIGVPIACTYYLIDHAIPLPDYHVGLSSGIVWGLLLFILALIGFVRFAPGFSVTTVCQGLCSALVAVVVLDALDIAMSVPGSAMFAIMLLCQYLVVMYAARLYRQGFGNVVKTFGVVQLINHAAGLLGSVTSVAVYATEVSVADAVPPVVVLGLLFAAALFVQEGRAAHFVPPAAASARSSESPYAQPPALDGSSHITSGDVRPAGAGERELTDAESSLATAASTAAERGELMTSTSPFPTLSYAGSSPDPCTRIAAQAGLSPREEEVLAYLVKGRSAPFIRDELVISLNTVNAHIKHIYAKVGVHSRQELIDLVDADARQ